MIRCAVCKGRVRPPPRPWTATKAGLNYYRTTADGMALYTKWLGKLAKDAAFVHEACAKGAESGTLPRHYMIALDLNARLRVLQAKGR